MADEILKPQLPPHSIEAEQALLGSIFLDNDLMNEIAGIVRRSEQFYRSAHRHIYDAMRVLNDAGMEIDWITVKNELEKRHLLEESGGQPYLVELTESTPTSQGAVQYAQIVRDKSVLRDIIHTAGQVRDLALDPTGDPKELIEVFEKEVFRLGQQRFSSESISIQEVMAEVIEQIEYFKKLRSENNAVPGLPMGYKDFDMLSTGFKGGELIILAARPGHGKTSLALNFAANVATSAHRRLAKRNKPESAGGVAFFSLEMRAVELVSRMLCSLAKVSLKDLRSGQISRAQERDIAEWQEQLVQAPVFIDDSFTISIGEIRAKARRLKERYDIEFLVVDYLQLIQGESNLDRHEQIGIMSRGLKGLARELDIPVLALSQLNRSIEQRRGVQQRPMLSDLRESGSIEQDADMVMFIQRDRMLDASKFDEARQMAANYADEDERREFLDVEPATLVIAKNRSGPIGDVELMFRKSCTNFEPRSAAYAERFRGTQFA